MVVFFVKSNKNSYPQARVLDIQMYKVVPKTKRGNCHLLNVAFRSRFMAGRNPGKKTSYN